MPHSTLGGRGYQILFVPERRPGAAGSAAGQIARIHGCRVVGIAGSSDKVRWIAGAVVPLMNPNGRVAVCGQISLYNLEEPGTGGRLFPLVLVRTLTVEGVPRLPVCEPVRRGTLAACELP